MYPASKWRILSGHSMMIRTCRSLQIPRSPGTHLQHQVFRHAIGCSSRLLLSSADLGRTLSNFRRRGGGKVESVLCFPSAASFPRPSSRRWLQPRLMSIVSAAGQHGPGDTRQFIRNRHHHLIAWSTLGQPLYPLPESSGVVFHAKQDGASTVDQHATQINVAALADAVQFLLAAGRVLPWHHPNPSCEVAPATKRSPVADSSHGGGGDQRAEAWDLAELSAARIFITNAFNLVGDYLDVGLDLLPLLPQPIQQPA